MSLALSRAVSSSSSLLSSPSLLFESKSNFAAGGARIGRSSGSILAQVSPLSCRSRCASPLAARRFLLPSNTARITLSSHRALECAASLGYGLSGLWGETTRRSTGGSRSRGGESGRTRNKRNVAIEASLSEGAKVIMDGIQWGWTADPPTWDAAFIAIGTIFVLAAPLLWVGLTVPGMFSAYILGSIIWRAYGGQGLLTIVLFYIIGTGATKLKLKQKQKEGIAEQRSGRRGPGSVWGSGTAGALCALCTIFAVGGPEIAPLWQLGYLASLCTKLSDTISSEIGKAYGKTTYLVTSFSIVPRGTEGAVSLEGTLAGLFAAVFLAAASYALNQVDATGAIIAILASQIANLFESVLGATLQGRAGFEWLSNDLVNVANITIGATVAIFAQKLLSG
ncbi:hypothetical protein MPTK1_6g15050 [Marchantia polymorpha subsp. ruderalis]|uniref:Uncharacterized protein n=2 Tax=Marchantia polymorpha TaxID=3197 RepID=A0AAF6BS71_MARPO|nr:hypothetical protein MARPO_0056s0015 [Marchantia polymorpha]BBN14855.1 hypothetical protein Mp_6g15050 [Marchantia polymorpha subsp. ruderalis]|eukprot:PTQ37536.1 hypothetical protein MARPO_0056s0015 [Marchantia polymorpha]